MVCVRPALEVMSTKRENGAAFVAGRFADPDKRFEGLTTAALTSAGTSRGASIAGTLCSRRRRVQGPGFGSVVMLATSSSNVWAQLDCSSSVLPLRGGQILAELQSLGIVGLKFEGAGQSFLSV